jgi:CheY-like chemotaxis protein
MTEFRLLLVEDREEDIEFCKDTLRRYKDQTGRGVKLLEARTVEEALRAINEPLDGAIIDLKLAERGDEGTAVIAKIQEEFHRIPVAILTATPDAAEMEQSFIGVYKKGEKGSGYDDLLDRLWEIYNTGLTKILGGRGIIEETLSTVFRYHILPNKDAWIKYGAKDSASTERALLRHTLSHLLQSLDSDDEKYYPEEVYLAPPVSKNITTGYILKGTNSGKWQVVLTPACDLALRPDGNTNSDRLLLVEIDSSDTVLPKLSDTGPSNEQRKTMEAIFANKKTSYHHWLPKTDYFPGGIINFRKIQSIPKADIP